MPPTVNWLARAREKIERKLVPLYSRELRQTFRKADSISVCDAFSGYSGNQGTKASLAVEVYVGESYNTHVVKLGPKEDVGNDYEGWHKCFSRHAFASRIFVPVKMCPLKADRAAIIYQNAYTLFGPDEETARPETLETIVGWAIYDNKPDPISVERVIRQIYGDLFQWFYRNSLHNEARALSFYRKRLTNRKEGMRRDVLEEWRQDKWRMELRQDVLWLANRGGASNGDNAQVYEDPVAYVGWAIQEKRIPQTLIGRSHGDIHGRNVIVGIRRGEVEYPAAFDYGEMGDRNVLVWDFVKLETELKVRLLHGLYEIENQTKDNTAGPTGQKDKRSIRADHLKFALDFENDLARLTDRIHEVADPSVPEPPGGRAITENEHKDRAIGILMRIRQEAALCLGDYQPQRERRGLWRDEYYFALAVYGLATAKFDYHNSEKAFALVSAGVAVANMEMARDEIERCSAPTRGLPPIPDKRVRHPYPSVQVPVILAHRIWRGQRTRRRLKHAEELLRRAVLRYPHAMALRQEYALILAELKEHEEARALLAPFRDLCLVFSDEETLSRIGRIYKDVGDTILSRDTVPVDKLSTHPAMQWYASALDCYQDAFDISKNYFPGINAATLAMLLGRESDAKAIAAEVAKSCEEIPIGALAPNERYWVLATEGEAHLLLGNPDEALRFYKEALQSLPKGSEGMVQSTFNQVCRLQWALGPKAVRRVVTLFKRSRFKLSSGPL